MELDEAGKVRVRRLQIPPPPRRADYPLEMPPSIDRDLRNGARVFRVLGGSMQPAILDNDHVIVSTARRPRDGDVVVVRQNSPHPIYGDVAGVVWRIHRQGRRAFLSKDNGRFSETPSVTSNQILGVVTTVIPRERRDELENYEAVQRDIELFRFLKRRPRGDLGFHSERTAKELREVVEIPESELIGGRLPWGLFRGIARDHHPHVAIAKGDTLTIEITPESYVGVIAIKRRKREAIIGRLEREGLDTDKPGEFFIDLIDRRVIVTHRGHPLWHTIGLIRRIETNERRHGERSGVLRG